MGRFPPNLDKFWKYPQRAVIKVHNYHYFTFNTTTDVAKKNAFYMYNLSTPEAFTVDGSKKSTYGDSHKHGIPNAWNQISGIYERYRVRGAKVSANMTIQYANVGTSPQIGAVCAPFIYTAVGDKMLTPAALEAVDFRDMKRFNPYAVIGRTMEGGLNYFQNGKAAKSKVAAYSKLAAQQNATRIYADNQTWSDFGTSPTAPETLFCAVGVGQFRVGPDLDALQPPIGGLVRVKITHYVEVSGQMVQADPTQVMTESTLTGISEATLLTTPDVPVSLPLT